VFFDVGGLHMTSEQVNGLLRPHGIRFSAMGPTWMRGVTHLDVGKKDIEEALDIFKTVISDNL